MAVQIQGNAGVVAEVDGTTFRAMRGVARPIDHGALGHYRIQSTTGTLAAALAAGTATAGHVFAFRWGDATRFAVITKLKTRFLPLTLFTAATLTDATSFDAFIVRSYSVSHGGGTALTPTGNNAKMRANMGTSLVTDVRISTTAALTNGTETFDAFPFAQSIRKANRVNPTAATEETIPPQFDGMEMDFDMGGGDHPIVLAQNEGIVIRNRTVWPAAGTGILTVLIAWAEVTAF
jgi:hypothetical protein